MIIHRMVAFVLLFVLATTLPACGQQQNDSTSSPDYQETKQMVVDILKTEDGKKAIQEIVQSPEFKEKLIMTDTSIVEAIDKALNDPKNHQNIIKLFQDPKVAANFAKTTQKEHEQLIKQLMKDPEYQKLLLDIMKNPEYQKQILDLMKTEPYRQQVMTIVTEALDNPIFKEKYIELLKKANEEVMRSSKGKQQGDEENQGGGGQQ